MGLVPLSSPDSGGIPIQSWGEGDPPCQEGRKDGVSCGSHQQGWGTILPVRTTLPEREDGVPHPHQQEWGTPIEKDGGTPLSQTGTWPW